MFLNYFNIIISINTSLIIILFLSIFSFQSPNNHNFNTYFNINNNSSNNLNNNNLMFSSIINNLALLSLIPLILSITYNTPSIIILITNWIPNNSLNINIELNFDQNFNIFFSIALFVSWSIIQFSLYYMTNDPNSNNFFRLLIIFLLNMIILTSSNNFFILFIGWEGVGFLSFLLISWWFTRNNANASAMQAIIYNRIGDIGLLMFFSLSISNFNSWSLSEISTLLPQTSPLNNFLLIGLLLAAVGKSAQFGLHPWLPAAMEGPTPVSALLHSSTMVVAGIFLLIRTFPLYQNSHSFNNWCLLIGSLTTLFAATTAIAQYDIKKIIAYSTTSQLGLMMIAIGLNQPNLALFHICTHAFFKAMLFLSSGSIIHSLNNEQDLRKMGGLFFLIPNTSACIFLGSLALSGIPFLAGFYSKDLILETCFNNISNTTSIILILIATMLTPAYSIRIIYFCFINTPSFSPLSPTNEENSYLNNALNRLAFGAIISGWLIYTFFMQNNPIIINSIIKLIILIIITISIIFSFFLLSFLSSNILSNLNSNFFLTNQWFYEHLSHQFFLFYFFFHSLFLSTRNIDQGWNENINPQGLNFISTTASQTYQLSQTAHIKQYLLSSILTFLVIITLTYFIS
uniref:NADH dehydrogenase subunit 5 n=1 Tax=Asthenactis papyraceus TaxID=2939277 RepID=UPI002027FF43|nr:NADH dehydrogenase subunit 5 [Asthenactis papyraceus]UPP55887.1 NADH dehydrogenase subunit 5 [Asthenactis papyraceus]